MDKATVDSLITSMLRSGKGVSDLLFIAGRCPLVEANGLLQEFPIENVSGQVLTPKLIDELAEHVTGAARD
jgi:hypothetical protein